MRVLLIATNRHNRLMSRMVAQPLPIGLAYVAGALVASQHEVKMLDLMFADDYLGEVEHAVHTYQPDLIGISIRNLSNFSYLDPQWALPISKEVVDKVRSMTPAPIICGGPAFSLLPKEVFDYIEPDVGLAGDAAEAVAELADCLESGRSYQHLEGVVYRKNGEIVFHGSRCASAFTCDPYLEGLDIPKYGKAGFGIGILTKLGGFYYPTSSTDAEVETAAWRVIRPIDEVVQEAQDMVRRYQLRKVFFIDNGFNLPLDHAKALCHALIEAEEKVQWNTCLAPVGCDAELLGLMKQAGCALVLMNAIPNDPEGKADFQARAAPTLETSRLCDEQGVHYTVSLTFGEPGETRHTVDEKLAFLRSMKPAMANLRIGVNLFPGTPLASQAVQEGMIADEAELIKPTFYLAESVRDWLVDDLREAASQYPRWNLI